MAAPSRHAAIPCSTISSGCSGRFGLASLPWMPPVSAQVRMTFVLISGMKHLLIQLRQKILPDIIHRNLARYVVRPAATLNTMRQQSEASHSPAGWDWHGNAHAVQRIERRESA